ncbi:MAG: chemotaxis protein CheY [Gammaproteobacteria bacterium SG8_11]|nr:MAG: chemotaxis protein CheY [Gammaproteobacteria bacterium SG8_11]
MSNTMPVLIDQIHVVLVEPSCAQHKIIEAYLRELGVSSVDWVQTGKQALEMLQRRRPDLLISAMYLEDTTGTELIQGIRAGELCRDVPFMLISSETNYRYLEPIRQAGVIAILPKPFVKEQLEKSLYATLDYFDPERVELPKIDYEDFKVLIVDDSETSRRHIKRLLRRMGLENITEAENGLQGLELIGDDFFDLIVTDYYMPEMDGKEFIERIREDSPQASVPILMVTSAANDESRLAAVRQAGVSAICDKPFEPKKIKQLIENII